MALISKIKVGTTTYDIALPHSTGDKGWDDVVDLIDSTKKAHFIVCTEEGVGYQLKHDNPGKRFYFGQNPMCCSDMKLNTAENILKCLESGDNSVETAPDIAEKALAALERMLKLAK